MQYLSILIILTICTYIASLVTGKTSEPVNILLSLPANDSFKFSRNKVAQSINLAINEYKKIDPYFDVNIILGDCDCSAIKATINAMENIYEFKYKKNNTESISAIFGPMCD